MTLTQQMITIAMVVLGTAITRFLPFLVFPAGKSTPKYIRYLGKVLPPAIFGLLVVYSLRNVDILSIECCHMDETGDFEQATYASVVKLTAWLCTRFGLTEENVIRHYDVTGKNCPKYYVEHPEAWEQMKEDIAAQIQEDYILQENL